MGVKYGEYEMVNGAIVNGFMGQCESKDKEIKKLQKQNKHYQKIFREYTQALRENGLLTVTEENQLYKDMDNMK